MRTVYQLTRLLVLLSSLMGLGIIYWLVVGGHCCGILDGFMLTLATGVLCFGAYLHSAGPLAFWRRNV